MRVGEVETVSMEAPDQATGGLVQLERRRKPSPGVTAVGTLWHGCTRD